jgi:hypothetical protein
METAWRRVCAEYGGDAVGRAAWSARPTRACEARGARRVDLRVGSARRVPPHMDRWALAGLGVRAQQSCGAVDVECRERLRARARVPGADANQTSPV